MCCQDNPGNQIHAHLRRTTLTFQPRMWTVAYGFSSETMCTLWMGLTGSTDAFHDACTPKPNIRTHQVPASKSRTRNQSNALSGHTNDDAQT